MAAALISAFHRSHRASTALAAADRTGRHSKTTTVHA